MSRKAKRTDHSGGVDKLPSGRWRARYTDPVTYRQRSAGTFATKSEAEDRLAEVRTDQRRGAWVDPDASNVTLAAPVERTSFRTRYWLPALEAAGIHRRVPQSGHELLGGGSRAGGLSGRGVPQVDGHFANRSSSS